jgi:hypothetical protein
MAYAQGQTEWRVGHSRVVQWESGPVNPPATGVSSFLLSWRSVSRWRVSFGDLRAFFMAWDSFREDTGTRD